MSLRIWEISMNMNPILDTFQSAEDIPYVVMAFSR